MPRHAKRNNSQAIERYHERLDAHEYERDGVASSLGADGLPTPNFAQALREV